MMRLFFSKFCLITALVGPISSSNAHDYEFGLRRRRQIAAQLVKVIDLLPEEDEVLWSRLMMASMSMSMPPTPAPTPTPTEIVTPTLQPTPAPTPTPTEIVTPTLQPYTPTPAPTSRPTEVVTTPPLPSDTPTPAPTPPPAEVVTTPPSQPDTSNTVPPTSAPSSQPTVEVIPLYENDFENPNKAVVPRDRVGCPLDGAPGDPERDNINTFYQKGENIFEQAWTVEVFVVNGTFWNSSTPYVDPDGTAGNYAISMLSKRENDLLGLSFNTSGKAYVNVAMDISSIDVNVGCGTGPFGIDDPIFRVSLLDYPAGLSVPPLTGTPLDFKDMTGPIGPNQWTFLWTRNSISLNATGSTAGRVSVVFDLIQSGYGALDNLVIEASDEPGTAQ